MTMKQTVSSLILMTALAACGGTDEADNVNDGRQAEPVVELTGCVGVSLGTGEIALRQLEYAGDDSARVAQSIPGITENAWVRLEGDQMESLMGQHVRLRGAVVDSGANTIGTAGVEGYEGHAGDTSQADSDRHYAAKQKLEAGRIARESLANGSAAKLRVLGVERTGRGECEAAQSTPTRDIR
jgi:hypothetical protein